MPSAGFDPAIKRPQTYALDRTVTGIVRTGNYRYKSLYMKKQTNLTYVTFDVQKLNISDSELGIEYPDMKS
jgi:hypothetical protein